MRNAIFAFVESLVVAHLSQYFTVDYNSCDDNDTLLFLSDESIIAGPMGLSGETGRDEVEEEQEGRL